MSNFEVAIYALAGALVLYLPARVTYKLAVLVSIPLVLVMAGVATADAVGGLFKEHHFGNKWHTFGNEASLAIGILLIAGAPLWLAISRWRRVSSVKKPLIPPDWVDQRMFGPWVGLGSVFLGTFACLSGSAMAAYLQMKGMDLSVVAWYFAFGAQLYFIGIITVEVSIRAWNSAHAT